mmetsp:Transcript_16840/g.63868  ORF Transcript_16840/g.63868 Transcript_16840/m.63868 type:complete len:292 (-) Transcript_16840:836-1711(-)
MERWAAGSEATRVCTEARFARSRSRAARARASSASIAWRLGLGPVMRSSRARALLGGSERLSGRAAGAGAGVAAGGMPASSRNHAEGTWLLPGAPPAADAAAAAAASPAPDDEVAEPVPSKRRDATAEPDGPAPAAAAGSPRRPAAEPSTTSTSPTTLRSGLTASSASPTMEAPAPVICAMSSRRMAWCASQASTKAVGWSASWRWGTMVSAELICRSWRRSSSSSERRMAVLCFVSASRRSSASCIRLHTSSYTASELERTCSSLPVMRRMPSWIERLRSSRRGSGWVLA